MKRPIYSAVFLAWSLLASPRLGVLQQPDSWGAASAATQTASGSGPASVAGQEAGKDTGQPTAHLRPSGPAQGETAIPTQAYAPEPWRTILAAKTVAVIGMDEQGKKCPKPPFPCGRRAREQTELSLRKWGRFSLVGNPAEAELVMVAMESFYVDPARDQTWAQLRVFKGPATPPLLAEIQKKLAAQLRLYVGPVPMEKQVELLWEGWRNNANPGVKNPTAAVRPSFGQVLGLAVLDAAGRKLRDKQFEERVKENPYDPEVAAEVGKSIGDAVTSIKELTGRLSKERHRLVAEDFSRAVAEAEKPFQAVVAYLPQARESAAPHPLLTSEPPKEEQPAAPLMWLELAAMLAGGRPVQEVTLMLKERGTAFDADREALWSLEALGAPASSCPGS